MEQEETSFQSAAVLLRNIHKADYLNLINFFEELKPKLNEECGLTFEFHHRLKSVDGIKKKLKMGKYVRDIIGIRLTNPWTHNLHLISNKIRSLLNIISTNVTERGRVIYLYGETTSGHLFEIQLWTNLIYHCFEFEHDRVYKPHHNLTEETMKKVNYVREEQHRLQDIIDENILVPYQF